MDFNQMILVAFLVESLIQAIKPIYDREKGWSKDALIALLVGVGICVLANINLFNTVKLPIYIGDAVIRNYVGVVLTGLIASRGSNLAHDIFKYVQNAASSQTVSAVG